MSDRVQIMSQDFTEIVSDSLCNAYTVHLPYFYDEFCSIDIADAKMKKDKYSNMNWITPDLKSEILALYPENSDVSASAGNLRSGDKFEEKAAKLFPVGRIFASHKQLDQVASLFSSAWAFKKTHPGKYIGCHYGKSVHSHRVRLSSDETKRRKVEQSPKEIVKCPFRINYHYVNYPSKHEDQLPTIFYQVRITSAEYHHSHDLSTVLHREARQRSGDLQPDLNGVSDVVDFLRNRPTLSANELRPFIEKYIPAYKDANSQFIVNFRNRCLKYILENDADRMLTQQDANVIADNHCNASVELIIKDNVLIKHNLKDVLRKVMQEDGSYWEAISFLEKIKKLNPNMLYKVKYTDDNRPEGILWMLPEMREDLVRFGDILFLDAQKRDFNQLGWPYIGPCIKDNEQCVRVVSECICIEESHSMYYWILSTMAELESRWSTKRVQYIFADQLITNSLLCDLGISDTCLLHGDPYHLKNKVFPELFGGLYNSLFPFLNEMISCKTQEAWKSAYVSATNISLSHPHHQSSLDEIYNNPSYYSQWYMLGMEGSYGCKGSYHAEQNHASVTAHLGRGGNFSIAEHIMHLTDRQIHLSKIRRTNLNQNRQARLRFRSKRPGAMSIADAEANKLLSHFAYKQLFYRESTKNMQVEKVNDTYHVWSCAYDTTDKQLCPDYIQFAVGERCPCSRRRIWLIQCKHELTVDRCFEVDKYDMRWMNEETYQEQVGDTCYNDMFCDNSHSDYIRSSNIDSQNSQSVEEVSQSNEVETSHDREYKLTYSGVMEDCEKLLRLISLDQTKMQEFSDTINIAIKRAQNNQSIGTSFDVCTYEQTSSSSSSVPSSRIGCRPNASNMRRLQSRHEKRSSYAARRFKKSNDTEYCTRNIKTKSCTLCQGTGHNRQHCPKVMEYLNNKPSNLVSSSDERNVLNHNLSKDNFFKQLYFSDMSMFKSASELPKSMKGIIMHKLFKSDTKRYVQCTVLSHRLDPHVMYQKFLFDIYVIQKYIVSCGKNSIIISQLEELSSESSSQQSMSQHSYPLTIFSDNNSFI